MSGYPEESALDEAVTAAVRPDSPDAVVVGWVVLAAYQTPESEDGQCVYAWYTPSGQPVYASSGLLDLTHRAMLASAEAED